MNVQQAIRQHQTTGQKWFSSNPMVPPTFFASLYNETKISEHKMFGISVKLRTFARQSKKGYNHSAPGPDRSHAP